MTSRQSDPPSGTPQDTPEGMLDEFRLHPDWSERERAQQLERLIVTFPVERLQAAIAPRLNNLSGADGEAVLRLLESYATPDLLHHLAESLLDQDEIPPERIWDAMLLLEEAGVLSNYPALLELRAELEENLDEESSLDELAEQLEGSPEGTWLALQGLGAVEPEVRTQIIAGLARVPLRKGLIEFLRLLCFAHDPAARSAALDAIARPEPDNADLVAAWESLVADNPFDEVVSTAKKCLEQTRKREIATLPGTNRLAPLCVRSLVTSVDGKGQATIVISSNRDGFRVTAAFLCDLKRGVRDVFGQVDTDASQGDETFRAFSGGNEFEVIEDSHELALRLLGGSVMLCGAEASPVLRYWLEEAVHPGFQPLPFPAPYPGWDPSSLLFDEMHERAEAVLDACPTWTDLSPLTYEIAEEIDLREGNSTPDPKRDAGAYRYLFEHRLLSQLEMYRRMLYWMASFWQASGADDLGRSALAFASQLSEAQHAIPAHPFTIALTTRSLAAAQVNLRGGLDPRRPPKKKEE